MKHFGYEDEWAMPLLYFLGTFWLRRSYGDDTSLHYSTINFKDKSSYISKSPYFIQRFLIDKGRSPDLFVVKHDQWLPKGRSPGIYRWVKIRFQGYAPKFLLLEHFGYEDEWAMPLLYSLRLFWLRRSNGDDTSLHYSTINFKDKSSYISKSPYFIQRFLIDKGRSPEIFVAIRIINKNKGRSPDLLIAKHDQWLPKGRSPDILKELWQIRTHNFTYNSSFQLMGGKT